MRRAEGLLPPAPHPPALASGLSPQPIFSHGAWQDPGQGLELAWEEQSLAKQVSVQPQGHRPIPCFRLEQWPSVWRDLGCKVVGPRPDWVRTILAPACPERQLLAWDSTRGSLPPAVGQSGRPVRKGGCATSRPALRRVQGLGLECGLMERALSRGSMNGGQGKAEAGRGSGLGWA